MFDIQKHLYILEDCFSSGISLKQHLFKEACVAYIGGIDEAKFNVFLQRQHLPQPEQLIRSVKKFFKENAISSWVYVVPSQFDTSDLQNELKHHGLVFDESSTAMYCSLGSPTQSTIEPETPLIIQEANTNRNGWLHVMHEAFGGTNETLEQYNQALIRAESKNINMQHFLGTSEGKPIATITLTFLGDWVRIDNVAILPTYQRLGYGSQIMQFGMNLSCANGVKHGVLDASADGLGVYQRLGFSEIFTYSIYQYG